MDLHIILKFVIIALILLGILERILRIGKVPPIFTATQAVGFAVFYGALAFACYIWL